MVIECIAIDSSNSLTENVIEIIRNKFRRSQKRMCFLTQAYYLTFLIYVNVEYSASLLIYERKSFDFFNLFGILQMLISKINIWDNRETFNSFTTVTFPG